MLERILGPLAKRWALLRVALDVQQRFSDVKGGYLSSAVTLNLFISMFPLILVGIAVLGFFTNRDAGLADKIITGLNITDSSTKRLFTEAVTNTAAIRKSASIVGFLGMLWTGLGVVAAMEYALDATWQLTGRSIQDKLRGIVWAIGAMLIFGLSIALTSATKYFTDGWFYGLLAALGSIVINIGLFLWTYLSLSQNKLDWRAYLPGAVLGATGLEAIKQISALLPGVIGGGTSPLYGPLSAVFALLAALAIVGRLLVYSSVLNVVRWEESHGTVTINVEVPRVPGEAPIQGDRTGAVDPGGIEGS